ncbi:hypothetical protein GCM10009601_16510 [Streptomyces thermospinosisporus]|uniref:Uncharacterized protein n=1 Tax=Streptomyces thermospinosisporus TaxID=161482 RepID=A0ABN1YRJ9_9ACTN
MIGWAECGTRSPDCCGRAGRCRRSSAGLLREGRKVQAIKVYGCTGEATGAGLAEAKEAVEGMERQG